MARARGSGAHASTRPAATTRPTALPSGGGERREASDGIGWHRWVSDGIGGYRRRSQRDDPNEVSQARRTQRGEPSEVSPASGGGARPRPRSEAGSSPHGTHGTQTLMYHGMHACKEQPTVQARASSGGREGASKEAHRAEAVARRSATRKNQPRTWPGCAAAASSKAARSTQRQEAMPFGPRRYPYKEGE